MKIIVSKIEKNCASKTGSLRQIREDLLRCPTPLTRLPIQMRHSNSGLVC